MNRSLASIADELAELENNIIQEAVEEAGRVAVIGSPVDTGRFKGNWDVMIDDDGYSPDPEGYDLSGQKTIREIESDALKFDIRKNKSITLYNDVYDLKDNKYASTVKYDLTENTAKELVETATLAIDQILSRD